MSEQQQEKQHDVQHVLIVGGSVYTIDFEGTLFLMCVCPNPFLAQEMTTILAAHYGVQAKQSNLDFIAGMYMSEFDTRPERAAQN